MNRNEVDSCTIFIPNHNLVDVARKWFGRSCTMISEKEQPPICGPDLKWLREIYGYESYRWAVKNLKHWHYKTWALAYFSLIEGFSGNALSKSFDQYQAHLNSGILLSQIPPKFEFCVKFFYTEAESVAVDAWTYWNQGTKRCRS